jgi:hypothetical protein
MVNWAYGRNPMLCHLGSGEGEDRQIGFKVSFKNNFVETAAIKSLPMMPTK